MFYRIGDDQKTSLMFDHERIPYDQRESLDSEMIQAFMGMARVRAEGLIVKSYPQDGTEPQDYYFYRS